MEAIFFPILKFETIQTTKTCFRIFILIDFLFRLLRRESDEYSALKKKRKNKQKAKKKIWFKCIPCTKTNFLGETETHDE